jgi:hypothetical protein
MPVEQVPPTSSGFTYDDLYFATAAKVCFPPKVLMVSSKSNATSQNGSFCNKAIIPAIIR